MSQSAPLDLIFPRPVLVTLAGLPYKAGPLTLGDLASLQSWLRQAASHPMALLPPKSLDPEPGTRRARLVAAWHAAKRWPPAIGSGDEGPYLDSPEGKVVFLLLCIKRWDDTFTADEAVMLVEEMTAADWTILRRVAWGIPPWRELAGELDGVWLRQQIKAIEQSEWSEAIASVMRHGHYDYDQIANWTPAQLTLYCSEGKLGEYRAARAPGETREQFVTRMTGTFRMPEAGKSF